MSTRILTGITTTGTPHLGNYVGAIRPAVAASRRDGVDAFFFLADYHALIKCEDPVRVQRSRLEIAASWLAAGLDPQRVTFYRQSDIPEIPQLTWLLTCVTAKGLLNRAHAYKAAVDKNAETGEDADAGIRAGLYMYPVLMAADILAFNAHQVPVGRDQVQHIEMARDIAQRFNHLYKGEFFTLPEAVIEDDVATLPGLDGRKMSKSYDNTIPLFAGGPKALRAAVMRIVTDSREPGEPKDPDSNALATIFRAFAGRDEGDAFAQSLREGLGWGDAKQQLVDRLERDIAPMRARYDDLMAHSDRVEDALREGASKARKLAAPLLERLREAVGLGQGNVQPATGGGKSSRKGTKKTARFVSFRDDDGRFRFRLLSAEGEELVLSRAFEKPQAAGACTQEILAMGQSLAIESSERAFVIVLNNEAVAESPTFVDTAARDVGMRRLRDELAALAAHSAG